MKQIAIRNREYRLSGRVGDPYFDNLTLADGTTDFLAHVCDHVLATDSVVFDVGANIGLTSLLFSAVARNGRVYAFEPGGETYGHLTATITENKLAHCVPLKLALGRETGGRVSPKTRSRAQRATSRCRVCRSAAAMPASP